jgi:hypothetical protein
MKAKMLMERLQCISSLSVCLSLSLCTLSFFILIPSVLPVLSLPLPLSPSSPSLCFSVGASLSLSRTVNPTRPLPRSSSPTSCYSDNHNRPYFPLSLVPHNSIPDSSRLYFRNPLLPYSSISVFSGTAKTTICTSIAAYLGWNFLTIDTASFLADGLQNVAARMSYIFDRLKALER